MDSKAERGDKAYLMEPYGRLNTKDGVMSMDMQSAATPLGAAAVLYAITIKIGTVFSAFCLGKRNTPIRAVALRPAIGTLASD
jgi:hypothetical protein